MNAATIIRLAVLSLALLALTACGGSPSKVSEGDLKTVRANYDSLQIGMSQKDVQKSLKKGNLIRLGSSAMEGASIEEYKLEAYHDDNWNKQRDLFVAFLYFADDTLVDMSNTRIDYRNKPDVVENWTK